MPFQKIMIAGAGTLGSQIAYQTAHAGFEVTVWNPHPEKAEDRLEKLRPYYKKDVGLSDEEFDLGRSNISLITSDLAAAVADVDLVIEAVPESPETKESFYHDLAEVAPAKTVFASNSSTFTPSQLVEYTDRPEKYFHMHFANQIWKYNVAEIVGNPKTDSAVLDEAVAFAEEIGMVPIRMKKEQSGYILNSLLIPMLNSAEELWATCVADPQDIDRDWMISTGAPEGPFIMLDKIGLRTAYNISENMYAQSHDEKRKLVIDRYKEMIDAGHYGLESGQGFYHYPNPEFEDPDFLK